MELQLLDLIIIGVYLIGTIIIGFWLSKKASSNLQNYFLAGNSIPWYMLGLSNASGMFDISGTMWMVYLLFVYGMKSVWIPWLWPVFNQIFLMIFLSVWLRRSNVMTGAEWIRFRFGDGEGARLSHLIVVVFAIITVITYVAYGFIGIGKFAAVFLPFELAADPATNEILYGLIITALTTAYVVKGGMYSVVFTEVLQYVIMTIASIAVGVIAMNKVSPEMISAVVPEDWYNIFFSWKLDLDWTGVLDAANTRIAEDGYELFGYFFIMVLLKGILQSMAGPTPSYDMQRVLSTKTPKEAAKMSGVVNLVLLFPRYLLIGGLTILAIAFFMDDLVAMGPDVDFEQILPFAIREFVPTGLMGLLIAGLIAAFMSTYAASVNSAPAYIVNDIYKRYINPDASDKTYVRMSYIASLAVVVIGVGFGLFLTSLNSIIDWLVAGLFGGYTAANLIKWYWWRFNGYGFFWGMVGGIVAAMVLPYALPNLTALEAFPVNLLLSFIGCLLGSYLTKPDDRKVLKQFYLQVRPWGFWKPIHDELAREIPELNANKDFGRDMLNVAVGIIWQTSLTAAPIFLVIKQFTYFGLALAVAVGTSLILKYNWLDKMEDWPNGYSPK
ncbi:MAG: sodium:solute symporter family protein [Bacteroidota bacterium]